MEISKRANTQLAPHANSAVVVLVIFLVLTLIFTALRFYSRWTTRRRFFGADWVLLAAEIFYIIYTAVSFVSLIQGGVGHHLEDLEKGQVTLIFKLLTVIQITYAVCMALLKTSVCLLYIHIFPHTWIKACSYGIIVLSACWALFTTLLGLLICRPIAALWDPTKGTCGNEQAGYSSVSGIELVIDIFIILLPLPVVWRLNTSTTSKIAMSSLFGLGLTTIVVTGVRLHVILNLDFKDFSYTAVDLYNLTVAELGVAFMVASSLGLRPLVEKWFFHKRWLSRKAAYGSNPKSDQYSMKTNGTTQNDQSGPKDTLDIAATDDEIYLVRDQHSTARVSAAGWPHDDEEAPKGQAITVSRGFTVEHENV
ncbi:hypothetical protein NLG97_g308 [Lecanicillium saksenae]|uniref:Uncharacterized protein n=1 Tax=Lecanicillium saksenae TaxID=468837 RepID=A0ACC1RAE8_9HYPO|nr:hypothetical protein NLG97_g308 [Lecanicillium saksenae]